MQHGGEEEEIFPIHQRDSDGGVSSQSFLQFQSGVKATKSTTEYQNTLGALCNHVQFHLRRSGSRPALGHRNKPFPLEREITSANYLLLVLALTSFHLPSCDFPSGPWRTSRALSRCAAGATCHRAQRNKWGRHLPISPWSSPSRSNLRIAVRTLQGPARTPPGLRLTESNTWRLQRHSATADLL